MNYKTTKMKKLVCVLMLCVGTLVTAQETKNQEQGVFEFEKEIVDYGQISQHEDGHREFKFTNIGESPITITNIKSSCGCSVAKKPSKPIMPGEKGVIRVNYATNRLGGFSKTFIIFSNASEKNKKIRIKGMVLNSVITQN
ncbi:MAG: hypothetical protein COB98_04005 [Flavobacteriaceae bacterium]|nr:MAG: hypothetical protein COB98_04005 [Flavobacteriaceae bacterium]